MRVTGFWPAVGLVIVGIMVADALIHPTGVKAAGGQIVSLEKNTGNQLLGTRA